MADRGAGVVDRDVRPDLAHGAFGARGDEHRDGAGDERSVAEAGGAQEIARGGAGVVRGEDHHRLGVAGRAELGGEAERLGAAVEPSAPKIGVSRPSEPSKGNAQPESPGRGSGNPEDPLQRLKKIFEALED